MDRVMRKRVFRHMRTAKAQIRLRICAVWSGPSVSANRIIGYYRMYEWRAKARMIFCACTGWSEFARFAHVRRHSFAWCDPDNSYHRYMHKLHRSAMLWVFSSFSSKKKAFLNGLLFSSYPNEKHAADKTSILHQTSLSTYLALLTSVLG